MIEAAFNRDILNVISSAHSEFQYTRRWNAPDPGILLNMESACAYIAVPYLEEAYKNPDDFLQEYLHSADFRTTQREIISKSPKMVYGGMVIELVKIRDLLEKGDTTKALYRWDEARTHLPEFLRVELDHYGLN
jgi:hypothetical protein